MPVVLSGVDELKRALKKYAPDLRKEMDATIKAELKSVIDEARGKVPGSPPGGLYGWQDKGQEPISRTSKSRAFPRYNSTLIRKGLVYRTGTSRIQPTGFAALFSLWNSSAAGSIIEVAGRENRYGREQMGNRGSKSTQKFGRSNNENAGRIFVGAMNDIGALKSYEASAASKQRSTGRLLYATYADRQGKTLDAVMKAIELAQRKFNERAKPTQSKAVA
jgi:hypothetical protein